MDNIMLNCILDRAGVVLVSGVYVGFDKRFNFFDIPSYRVPCIISMDGKNLYLDFHGSMIYSGFNQTIEKPPIFEELEKRLNLSFKVLVQKGDTSDFMDQMEIFKELGIKKMSLDEMIPLFDVLNLVSLKSKESKERGNFITINPGFSNDISFFVLIDPKSLVKLQDMIREYWGRYVLSRAFGKIIDLISDKYGYDSHGTTILETVVKPDVDGKKLRDFLNDISRIDERMSDFLNSKFSDWVKIMPDVKVLDFSKLMELLVMSRNLSESINTVERALLEIKDAFLKIDEDAKEFLKETGILE